MLSTGPNETTLYLGLHMMIEVPRTFLTTVVPGGDRQADVVDVAIAPFPPEHLVSLDDAGFLPEEQMGDWTGPSVGRSYMSNGPA